MAVHMISGKECVALRDSLVKHLSLNIDDKGRVSYADVTKQYDVNISYCNIVVTKESKDKPAADENHENSGTIVVSVTKKDLENPSNQDQTANKNNGKSLLDEVFNSTNESGDVTIMDNHIDAYATIFLKLISKEDPKYKLEGVRLMRWNTKEAKYYTFEFTEGDLNELAKTSKDSNTDPDPLVFSKGAAPELLCLLNFILKKLNISIPNDAFDKSFLIFDAMAHFSILDLKYVFKEIKKGISDTPKVSIITESFLKGLIFWFSAFFDPDVTFNHDISIDNPQDPVVAIFKDIKKEGELDDDFDPTLFIFDHSISKDTRSSWKYWKQLARSKQNYKPQDTTTKAVDNLSNQDTTTKAVDNLSNQDITTKQAESNWKTYLLWGGVVIACLVLVGLIIYLAYVIISK